MRTLLFHAEPFGFGPASLAASVAGKLRRMLPEGHEIAFLGNGVAHQLARVSRAFDRVISCGERCADSIEAPGGALGDVAYFLTAMSPTGVRFARERGYRCGYVDALFWFFDALDPVLCEVDDYFVQKLGDTRAHQARLAFFHPNMEEVGWILPDTPSRQELLAMVHGFARSPHELKLFRDLALERGEKPLVVTFGGVDNFFHSGSDYPQTICRLLLPILQRRYPGRDILLLGGGQRIARLQEELPHPGGRLWSGTVPPEWSFHLVSTAVEVFFSAGLSAFVEVASRRTRAFFLPPQNYSQWLQIERFRELGPLSGFSYLDAAPSLAIPEHLAEEEGVRRVAAAYRAFTQTEAWQTAFAEAVCAYLETGGGGPIPCHRLNSDFLGAEQVATAIARRLHESRPWSQLALRAPEQADGRLFKALYKTPVERFVSDSLPRPRFQAPRPADLALAGAHWPAWITDVEVEELPAQIELVTGGPCVCWCEGALERLSLQDLVDIATPLAAAQRWNADLALVVSSYEAMVTSAQPVEYGPVADAVTLLARGFAADLGYDARRLRIVDTSAPRARAVLDDLERRHEGWREDGAEIDDIYNFTATPRGDVTAVLRRVFRRNVGMYTGTFFRGVLERSYSTVAVVENSTQAIAVRHGAAFAAHLGDPERMHHFCYLATPGTTGIEMARSTRDGSLFLGDSRSTLERKVRMASNSYVKSYFAAGMPGRLAKLYGNSPLGLLTRAQDLLGMRCEERNETFVLDSDQSAGE